MKDTRSAAENRPEITIDAMKLADLAGQVAAIDKALAVIEFKLDGTVLTANQNFLRVMGYALSEIVGQHHRMFVAPAERSSNEYRMFWERLARGEYDANRYKRITRDGREKWIQASYNPILLDDKPYKVVKYATDVTAEVEAAIQNARLKNALDKASASVLLADVGYDIIYANDAALKLFGEAQADFRRDIPALDAAKIVGSNIDIFHRNPAHQRQILDALRSTTVSDIRVAGRAMRVAASPVFDSRGKRLGTVVEWFDRTQEVRAEEQVTTVVRKALEGDMIERIPLEGKTGSIATMAAGINQLLDNNVDMMRQIREVATAVRQGAEEISQGNSNLSTRTEEQSSTLEQTAASMEQMSSSVKQNADNAGEASKLAIAARDQAEAGSAVVGKAVNAMGEIHAASKKIADILSLIDSIAFQTNLLALNAAVEAARAGEQGRGFAVVATEVRSLAGRSATAAKEIKALIEDSALKVTDGSKLVTQSGQTLEQIVLAVKKVSDIVGEIAVASREQSVGVEQVNRAVTQMDEMTQQNAALAEQATAASQSMSEQAAQLSELLASFRIDLTSEPAVQPAKRPASVPVAATPPRERRAFARPR